MSLGWSSFSWSKWFDTIAFSLLLKHDRTGSGPGTDWLVQQEEVDDLLKMV